jgi:hypothetical protein
LKVGVNKQMKNKCYGVVISLCKYLKSNEIFSSVQITNKVKKMVRLQFQLIVLRLQFFLVYSGLIDRRSIANKILWELQKLFD